VTHTDYIVHYVRALIRLISVPNTHRLNVSSSF